MAMIRCKECKKWISDKAESCPNCGAPARVRLDVFSEQQVQTIQKTAKRWKGQMVLAVLVAMVGIILLAVSVSAEDAESPRFIIGAVCVPIGVFWFFVARIVAWWHHA